MLQSSPKLWRRVDRAHQWEESSYALWKCRMIRLRLSGKSRVSCRNFTSRARSSTPDYSHRFRRWIGLYRPSVATALGYRTLSTTITFITTVCWCPVAGFARHRHTGWTPVGTWISGVVRSAHQNALCADFWRSSLDPATCRPGTVATAFRIVTTIMAAEKTRHSHRRVEGGWALKRFGQAFRCCIGPGGTGHRCGNENQDSESDVFGPV